MPLFWTTWVKAVNQMSQNISELLHVNKCQSLANRSLAPR